MPESVAVPVIAIDGPSGSGKGAVAAEIARRLGFNYLDSGALYRILGLAAQRSHTDTGDIAAIRDLAAKMRIEFGADGADSVKLDGEDISAAIRTERAGEMASRIAAIPTAREALNQRQLQFRQPPGLVADGRDMGTVVFPDAVLKIFLTASVEERARRRYKQLIGKGIDAILPDLLRDLRLRDQRDTRRSVSPLKPAKDAVVLDTTTMTLNEVLDWVMGRVHERLPAQPS